MAPVTNDYSDIVLWSQPTMAPLPPSEHASSDNRSWPARTNRKAAASRVGLSSARNHDPGEPRSVSFLWEFLGRVGGFAGCRVCPGLGHPPTLCAQAALVGALDIPIKIRRVSWMEITDRTIAQIEHDNA